MKSKKLKCKKCGKEIKENTGGNLKYCQGHSIFEK
jgi:ribosomal protein S27E